MDQERRTTHIAGLPHCGSALGLVLGPHVVHFYDSDAALCRGVTELIGAGLASGDPVLVIATDRHEARFCEMLEENAVDVRRARDGARLTFADASELLTSVTVQGEPHWELFDAHVGRLVREAQRPGRRLRVFAELVGLLWNAGNLRAAVRVETLWGELARRERLSLVCSCAIDGFCSPEQLRLFGPVCNVQAHVFSGEAPKDGVPAAQARAPELRVEDGERVRRRSEMLVRIGETLATGGDLQALSQKIIDDARELCGAQIGVLVCDTLDERGGRRRVQALSGVSRDAFTSSANGGGASGPVPYVREVLRLDDVLREPGADEHALHFGAAPDRIQARSYLAVPLKALSGDVLGGLFFGHERPRMFDHEDERALTAVAAQTALAIDNERLSLSARSAELAAQSDREKLRRMFAHAPAMITIVRGPEHVFEFVNPIAERLVGPHAVGKRVRDVLPQVDPGELELLNDAFETGQRRTDNERALTLDLDGRGGEERFFDFVYEPYLAPDGRVEGVMSFGFDVTDQVLSRRKAEAVARELEVASTTKDEFLAMVSHELRTPLNAIVGWVRMLRSGSLREEKRARALETIERNAAAQAQLIEDLLDVSRIVSGKLRLEIELLNPAVVVKNAIEAVRPAAVAKGIAIEEELAADAGPILADANRLQQVVWNLLTNAVKFTPKGGRVRVVLARRDTSIEVEVADDGQGIEPEFVPHIFERFRQADSSFGRKHGGLGLGLAIVRHLVELHGGWAEAHSEGRGRGATFTISLPISVEHDGSLGRPPPVRVVRRTFDDGGPGELQGVRVLVVDDEPDARELLAEVLSESRATIWTAASTAEALELVSRHRPDVIVSDIGMPGEDGYALIKKLRALPPEQGGRTPAVALTAYARVEDRLRALGQGFDMHVPKPVEPSELLAVLKNLTAILTRD